MTFVPSQYVMVKSIMLLCTITWGVCRAYLLFGQESGFVSQDLAVLLARQLPRVQFPCGDICPAQ